MSVTSSTSQREKTRKLTVISALAAVTAIISFLPLKTLGLEITFSMVPVAVGAIIYGPFAGAILGFVFGAVSFIQCFGYSPFGATLFGISPLYTFVMCVPTRILAGWIAGLIYKSLNKISKEEVVNIATASVCAPFLNTVFFMSALVLLFYNTDFIKGIAQSLKAENALVFVLLFVGINGLVEIIAGSVIAFPTAAAIKKFEKTRH